MHPCMLVLSLTAHVAQFRALCLRNGAALGELSLSTSAQTAPDKATQCRQFLIEALFQVAVLCQLSRVHRQVALLTSLQGLLFRGV